jgi:hypothetical protein
MRKYEAEFYEACIEAIDKTIRKEFKHVEIKTTQDDVDCWHDVTVHIGVTKEANIELKFKISGKYPGLAAMSAAESLRKLKLELLTSKVRS